MPEKIPFRMLDGGWDRLKGDLPREMTRREDGVLETSDLDWIDRAEKKGAIELNEEGNFDGIRKITIIEGPLQTDPVEYLLEIDLGERTGEIKLAQNEVLSYKRFREKYLATFQHMLPQIGNVAWAEVIKPLIKEAERIQADTDEEPAVDRVLDAISHCKVVLDKDEAASESGDTVWLDKATNTLFVPSRTILEPIAKGSGVSLRRLAELMKRFRRGKSKTIPIGGSLCRMWQFDPSRVKIGKTDSGGED